MSAILKRTGKLGGAELRWIGWEVQVMELLHQRTFGEIGVHRRIFAVDGNTDYAMSYLPPSEAASMKGVRVEKGQDAFLIGIKRFMDRLEVLPGVYSSMLGVNRSRDIPKYLMTILIAVHECRHKAHRLRGLPYFGPKTILPHLKKLIPRHEMDTAGQFLLQWLSCDRLVHGEGHRRSEIDARLIEGMILFFWDHCRRRGIPLLEKYCPPLILLGS